MHPVSLKAELRKIYPAYAAMFVISVFIAVLVLAPPLYLLQVHERVYTSRNLTTLGFLTAIVLLVLLAGAGLQMIRGTIASRAALQFVQRTQGTVFLAAQRGGLKTGSARYAAELQQVRDALGGPFIAQVFDLMMSPIFLFVLFLIHPVYGLVGVGILTVLLIISVAAQLAGRKASRSAQEAQAQLLEFSGHVTQGSDAARAMGMVPGLMTLWKHRQTQVHGWQGAAARRVAPFMFLLRFVRSSQLVIVVGTGALLYIAGAISAAGGFAALIILMRGIGPIESVVAGWRSASLAREAFARLVELTDAVHTQEKKVSLPRPRGRVAVAHLTMRMPGAREPILSDVSFSIEEGCVLAIIGQSGAGKSSLLRCVANIHTPDAGTVSLDGHAYEHWNADELGRMIGYLPQDTELLPGTVAQNISRFDPDVRSDNPDLFAAVRAAQVEDLIKRLPQGFNTRIGPGGNALSGGERQRLALARALYGSPPLLLLDEPYSALDMRGEEKLVETIRELAANGTSVLLVTHKLNMLQYCDQVLVMHSGHVQAFGQREMILQRLAPAMTTPAPLRVVDNS